MKRGKRGEIAGEQLVLIMIAVLAGLLLMVLLFDIGGFRSKISNLGVSSLATAIAGCRTLCETSCEKTRGFF